MIRNGTGKMPAVGNDWSQDQLDATIAYLHQRFVKGGSRWRPGLSRPPVSLVVSRPRHELADDRRPQADRDPLHRHEPRLLPRGRHRSRCFMRAQLATPNEHFVTRDHYNELFTMHGTTMIFLVVVPILGRASATTSCR